ncbi:hypothetical protein ASG49_10750 [Marmoricola sp. Leaf446]|nr:hypothetical protein ASG49_10750 [Marmoricola sp. Leaf446]
MWGRTTSAQPSSRNASKAARSGRVTWVLLANAATSKTSSSCGAMFQSPTSATSPVIDRDASCSRASQSSL